MAGVIRGRSPLILVFEDAPQLCCGVVHLDNFYLSGIPLPIISYSFLPTSIIRASSPKNNFDKIPNFAITKVVNGISL